MDPIVTAIIVIVVLAAIGFFALIKSIIIVQQSTAVVIERLGKFHTILDTGLHFILPFFDRKVGGAISLKERVADFMPQSVITKDNVTMQIDTVVYFYVSDPKLFCYGVERPVNAIENLTATTLRNLVGELDLDSTLTSRDTVNTKMRAILDEATDPWGIKINRVELKNILPPKQIQEAMEKQMRAEREKRESILLAEGEKESAILRAEAKKAALIAEAEGAATAIQMINKANPSQAYLTLQSYEALAKVADGQSTKIIIPSEIQNVAGLLAGAAEVVKETKPKAKKEPKA